MRRSTTNQMRRGIRRSATTAFAVAASAKIAASRQAVLPLAVGRLMASGQSPSVARSASIVCQGNGSGFGHDSLFQSASKKTAKSVIPLPPEDDIGHSRETVQRRATLGRQLGD